MINSIIANNLKAFRQARKWSLTKAAEETNVSKAMLGQIERQESSPTIATLWKIAKGFHVPMSALIEDKLAVLSVKIEQQEQLSKPLISFDNIEFKVLFAFDPSLCCEMFAHNVKQGKTHLSQPHESGVIEDIIVISGTLDVLIKDHWQRITSGNTLRFHADVAHGYRNSCAQEVIFHNIIHYPKSVKNQ
jgi:transcriptional regulator with XRE-family HTH domain